MGQLSEELYNFVNKREAGDLNIAADGKIEATRNDDEAKEWVFRKSHNQYVLVYVPTAIRSYLVIRSGWFSEYVGDQLGTIYDCYIAEF